MKLNIKFTIFLILLGFIMFFFEQTKAVAPFPFGFGIGASYSILKREEENDSN